MPPLWKNKNFREKTAWTILRPTIPSNFVQKIRKKQMSRFWEKSKKPYFRVILGVPGHAQCGNFNCFLKFTNSNYLFYNFTRLDQKLVKIGQTIPEILVKMRFSDRKCRNYGKIRIFGKKPLGPFYDPLFPLTLCKKSEKQMGRFWEKSKKPYFRAVLGVPGGMPNVEILTVFQNLKIQLTSFIILQELTKN